MFEDPPQVDDWKSQLRRAPALALPMRLTGTGLHIARTGYRRPQPPTRGGLAARAAATSPDSRPGARAWDERHEQQCGRETGRAGEPVDRVVRHRISEDVRDEASNDRTDGG
mgnify:FL=1